MGIDNSSGEWIIFLDGDDWLEYDALENFKESIEKDCTYDIIVSDFFTNEHKKEKKVTYNVTS